MQIYALNEKNERISSGEAEKKRDFYCIECGYKVRLRGGFQKRLHFFHVEKTPHCKLAERSELHLAVQNHFNTLFKNEGCVLERRFSQIQRVADICIESRKWIFEIQCSPISLNELVKRSHQYQSMGYTIFWILHEKSFLQDKQTEVERYLRFRPHFYTDINEEGKGTIFDAHLHIERGRQTILKKSEINLKKFTPFATKPNSPLPWVRARMALWPGYFENDCLFEELNRKNDRKTMTNFPLKIFQSLKTVTKILYKTLLENSSK